MCKHFPTLPQNLWKVLVCFLGAFVLCTLSLCQWFFCAVGCETSFLVDIAIKVAVVLYDYLQLLFASCC